jgi:Flp pilus assembly protein TadD
MKAKVHSRAKRLRYPTSGQLVRRLVKFLFPAGLPRNCKPTTSVKTVQNYFGGKRVSPKSVAAILDALVRSVSQYGLLDTEVFGEGLEAKGWMRNVLEGWVARWDALASRMSSVSSPVVPAELTMVPFLRLTVLDLGLRWGAYQRIRALMGQEPVFEPEWLTARAFADVMDEYVRNEAGEKLSLEKIIGTRGQATKNTIAAWRAGKQVPSDLEKLRRLAKLLADHFGADEAAIGKRLRLAAWGSVMRRLLVERLGDERHVENLALGFRVTARRAFEQFHESTSGPDQSVRIERLRDVTRCGARAELGIAACHGLASRCASTALRGDIEALSTDWNPRIDCWLRMSGMLEANRSNRSSIPVQEAKKLFRAWLPILFAMDLDAAPPGDIVITDPVLMAAVDHGLAIDAVSRNDPVSALKHAQSAVALCPEIGGYHRQLGGVLRQLVAAGRLEALVPAFLELLKAVVLDPEDDLAQTEIGILYSRAGLLGEAEESFARMDRLGRGRQLQIFHHEYGITLAWNGKFSDAESRLETARRLDPESHATLAMLAAVKRKLGKKREAKRLAGECLRVSGKNPLDNWETLLKDRPNATVRWIMTSDGCAHWIRDGES